MTEPLNGSLENSGEDSMSAQYLGRRLVDRTSARVLGKNRTCTNNKRHTKRKRTQELFQVNGFLSHHTCYSFFSLLLPAVQFIDG